MAAFTQQTFFGASIRNFNCSLGWSTQPSQLTVNVAEDDKNGDSFQPHNIGDPIHFAYSQWTFNGLLQGWRRSDDQGGSPLYEITLVDPREVLDGVQLILADYNGSTFGVPNLFNIYGYLESFSYGNADINESGMAWFRIRDSIQALSQSTVVGNNTSAYGGAIRFSQSNYVVNLSLLPQLPDYYRIGGNNISLMDYITEVCEAGGCDYFITMEATGTYFTIQINTINRRNSQILGQISNFIANATGVESKNYGYELLQNTTSKFVVGGNIESIYYQYSDSGVANDYTDDTIWPFWGFDANGNAILGTGQFESDSHRFTLDSRSVNVYGVGAYYETNVGELRSALDSFDAWMYYLMIYNDVSSAPQYQRYNKIGGIAPINDNWVNILNGTADLDALKKLPPQRIGPTTTQRQAKKAQRDNLDPNPENMMRLYDYVRSFASEYYGRKFMVRTPFIFIKVEPETLRIALSQEPNDSGFLDEGVWENAISNNLLPFDVDRLTTEEGKIEAYVRFDNAPYMDLSEISPDDYVMSDNGYSVFVKCRVNPGVVYLDASIQYSPRAVIELSGPVRKLLNYNDQLLFHGQIVDTLNNLFNAKPGTYVAANANQSTKNSAIKDVVTSWAALPGSEWLFLGKHGMSLMPTLVALPLRSNVDMYGPWYASGAAGKLEFEHDDTLVPWNYAGYTVMNLAANAKVADALIQQQISEAGTVEVAGAPEIQLGAALVNNGPYVTDIRVSIGEQGASTTYNMQLSPRFGKLSKYTVDRIARLAKTAQRFRRSLRQMSKIPTADNKIFKQRENLLWIPPGQRNKSSHMVIQGECIPATAVLPSGNTTYHTAVATQPSYHLQGQSYTNYTRKGIMSLDGLFVPFSTNVNASGLPHYRNINFSSADVIRADVDPYTSNHGIGILARDDDWPENGLHEDDGYSSTRNYRPIAFRGPVIIAGWGVDGSGNPVPTAASGDPNNLNGNTVDYPYNIKQRPDLWKVGPLDARWDEDRGMWNANGGSSTGNGVNIYRAIAVSHVAPYASGSFNLIVNDIRLSGITYALSWLGQPICSGQRAFLVKDNGNYYCNLSEFSSLSIPTNTVCISGVNYVTRKIIYFPAAYASG